MLANISLIMFLLLCIPCEFRKQLCKGWDLKLHYCCQIDLQKKIAICLYGMLCSYPETISLLFQSKRKPNETQKILLHHFQLPGLALFCLWNSLLHWTILGIWLHFDYIFLLLKYEVYIIQLIFLYNYAVLAFIVFYYIFKIVQLSPVPKSRIFSSLQ